MTCIAFHHDIPERGSFDSSAEREQHGTWRLADSRHSLTLTVKHVSCNNTVGGIGSGGGGKSAFRHGHSLSFSSSFLSRPRANYAANKPKCVYLAVPAPRAIRSFSFFFVFAPFFSSLPSRSLIRLASFSACGTRRRLAETCREKNEFLRRGRVGVFVRYVQTVIDREYS